MLEPLLRTAAAVGLDLDISSSKALADSLDRAVVRMHSMFFFPFNFFLLLSFCSGPGKFFFLNFCIMLCCAVDNMMLGLF